MTIDARALAKASGAASRAYPLVAQLVAACDSLPLTIRRQAVSTIEELDLLRHYLREATLEGVIGRNEAANIQTKRASARVKREMEKRAGRKTR